MMTKTSSRQSISYNPMNASYVDYASVINEVSFATSIDQHLESMLLSASEKQAAFDYDQGEIAIWGYGFVGKWFAQTQIEKVSYSIYDSNCNAQIPLGCERIEEVGELLSKSKKILIGARHCKEDIQKVIGSSCTSIGADEWYLGKYYSKILETFHAYMHDDTSRRTFYSIILTLLTGAKRYAVECYRPNIYFDIPGFAHTFDDFFLDAGAYVGDTVEDFIRLNMGSFRGVAAFEPGPKQFRALKNRKKRLTEEWALDEASLMLFQAGLSDTTATMYQTFSDDHILRQGLSYESSDENKKLSTIHTYRIDDLGFHGDITFIKADVEGMESNLINGAKNTIRTNVPKMALSAYHYPEDLIKIPALISSISKDSYDVFLRQHASVIGDYVYYFKPKNS